MEKLTLKWQFNDLSNILVEVISILIAEILFIKTNLK